MNVLLNLTIQFCCFFPEIIHKCWRTNEEGPVSTNEVYFRFSNDPRKISSVSTYVKYILYVTISPETTAVIQRSLLHTTVVHNWNFRYIFCCSDLGKFPTEEIVKSFTVSCRGTGKTILSVSCRYWYKPDRKRPNIRSPIGIGCPPKPWVVTWEDSNDNTWLWWQLFLNF